MFDVSMTSKINLPFQSFCMCLVSFYRNELPYYFTLKKVSLKLNAITSVFRGHKATIGADGDEIYTEDLSLNMHFCTKNTPEIWRRRQRNIHRKDIFEYALLYKEYSRNIQHLAKTTSEFKRLWMLKSLPLNIKIRPKIHPKILCRFDRKKDLQYMLGE